MRAMRVASGLTVLAVAGIATSGWAAGSPELKASRNCRKAIASALTKVTSTTLGVIGGCHKSRDKGKFTGDCNDLAAADVKAKVSAAQGKGTAAIAKKCAAGEVVLRNYADHDPAGSYFPLSETTLETTGAAVLGAPQIVGQKDQVKCHAAIVKAEVADVAEILKAATTCQNGEDKLADTFGALDCVATAAKAGPKGEAAIGKACVAKQITGADVGSCDPLPGCVTQAATASGQALAAAIYGQPSATCQPGDKVKVVASIDKTYGGASITIAYPDAVNIPGTGTADSVKQRVQFANAGLTAVNDDDAIGADGIDDTLTASLVGAGVDNSAGPFATVTFDCIAGSPIPAAGAFVCGVASASTSGGDAITDAHCTIEVQ